MEVIKDACYFQTMKKDPDVQGALSLFRLWQKQYLETPQQFCHISYQNNTITVSEEAKQIIDKNIPLLSLYIFILTTRIEMMIKLINKEKLILVIIILFWKILLTVFSLQIMKPLRMSLFVQNLCKTSGFFIN